jgi:hypothetical protein
MGSTVANLTITVDEETLKRARIRALEEDTSVSAVLRARLEEYARGRNDRRAAGEEILAAARRSKMKIGGRSWTREELHERGRRR